MSSTGGGEGIGKESLLRQLQSNMYVIIYLNKTEPFAFSNVLHSK